MLYDDSEIKTDGIAVEDLDDDQLDEVGKKAEEETADDGSQPSEQTNEEEEETTSDEDEEEEPKKEPTKESEEDEEKLPFHKHPRWKEITEQNKTLKAFKEKAEPILNEVESIKEKLSTSDKEEIPKWFSDGYPENTEELWAVYKKQQKDQREEIKAELKAEMKAEKEAQQKENKELEEWRDNELQKLVDEGKKFNKNELIDVMLKYKPIDDDGNLDFQKGYEIYDALKVKKSPAKAEPKPKPSTTAKKKIASTSTKSGSESDEDKEFLTPQDLRHKSFQSLGREE